MDESIAKKVLKHTRVASQSEIDQSQWHVCGTVPYVADSKTAKCQLCGKTVYFADDQPKLKKVCFQCVMPTIMADPNPECLVSEQALEHFKDAFVEELGGGEQPVDNN